MTRHETSILEQINMESFGDVVENDVNVEQVPKLNENSEHFEESGIQNNPTLYQSQSHPRPYQQPIQPSPLVPINQNRRRSLTSTASTPSNPLQMSVQPDWIMDFSSKSYYKDEKPLDHQILNLKERSIQTALLRNDPKLNFVEFSKSTNGLITNQLRLKIWPILLDIKTTSNLNEFDDLDVEPHKDEDQVKLDIQRSFNNLPTNIHDSYTTISSKSEIDHLKKRLFHLIVRVLRKYPSLNYYQGYHDIASIVLLVAEDSRSDLAFLILEKITLYHFRDFMISSINLSVNHLRLVPALLEKVDPELYHLVKQLNDGYNFYQGLSCILTQFSHDIPNLQQVFVLWDFVWSYNSVLVNVYIYVASLQVKRANILDKLGDLLDSSLIHTLISPTFLFGNLTDEELLKILTKTKLLLEDYPLESLNTGTFDIWFEQFNQNSVLLTTSNINGSTDLESLLDIITTQEAEISSQVSHELEDETDYSSNPSLASSVTLTSASLTSSFKKIFIPEDEPKKNFNLYKISITVGFIGFLTHFLIIKSNPNFYSQGVFRHVSVFAKEAGVGLVGDVYKYVRESEFAKSFVGLG